MSIAFDTLKLAGRLASGGFTDEQAKTAAIAFSDAFTADLATKGDLFDVRQEIGEIRREISDVRREIADAKTEMIKWLVGAIGFQTIVILGTLITLLKLFMKA